MLGFCPDMAVIVEDGRVVGFDYKHCKGCGICAKECPSKVHAIDMVPEAVSDTDRTPSMNTGEGNPVDDVEGTCN